MAREDWEYRIRRLVINLGRQVYEVYKKDEFKEVRYLHC